MQRKNKFLVGTSGWSYDHWQGKFYPSDLPKGRWFAYYSTHFQTVEVNATYYRNFKEDTYTKWYQQAPDNFIYALKAHRIIVHRKQIDSKPIKKFLENASLLKNKLGPILLQFSSHAHYDIAWLKNLLLSFPKRIKLVVEFRNASWLTPDVKKLLRKLQVAFCCSDAPGIDFTSWITSDIGYIRLHGYDNGDWYSKNYSKKELQNIAKIAHGMLHHGAKQVYIFFNNDFMGYAPKNAQQFLKLL